MPDFEFVLTPAETSLLESLGIKDQDTKLNSEDLELFLFESALFMRDFNQLSPWLSKLSAKIFALETAKFALLVGKPEVIICSTFSEDFTIINEPSMQSTGFTAHEYNSLEASCSRINLLSENGETIQTRKLSEDSSLPVIYLINPFPLSPGCNQLLNNLSTRAHTDLVARKVQMSQDNSSSSSSTLQLAHGNAASANSSQDLELYAPTPPLGSFGADTPPLHTHTPVEVAVSSSPAWGIWDDAAALTDPLIFSAFEDQSPTTAKPSQPSNEPEEKAHKRLRPSTPAPGAGI